MKTVFRRIGLPQSCIKSKISAAVCMKSAVCFGFQAYEKYVREISSVSEILNLKNGAWKFYNSIDMLMGESKNDLSINEKEFPIAQYTRVIKGTPFYSSEKDFYFGNDIIDFFYERYNGTLKVQCHLPSILGETCLLVKENSQYFARCQTGNKPLWNSQHACLKECGFCYENISYFPFKISLQFPDQ
ncbi:hypothetical protein SNEBB_009309 [Seison nebaliae]|nr:hypothetical protein SNEBB_009309 [Seison nebaliae]